MARLKRKERFSLPRRAETKWVLCLKGCGAEVAIDGDSIGGICWRCVQIMAGPPAMLLKAKKKEEEKNKIRRARGWKFMKEYVDSEGNVFFKGEEQPELKGTKEPTAIKPKVKKSVFERERERVEKQNKLVARYKRKQEKLNGKKKRGRKKRNKNQV
jgi:hypothetical protein